jgi:PadR family transcriptional regulator PadR
MTKVRKALIELWLMGRLARGQSYGYQLQELLFEKGQKVPAGTIYPILARFRRAGWVAVRDNYSPLGPRRQYYRLTSAGKQQVKIMAREWRSMARATEKLLKPKP